MVRTRHIEIITFIFLAFSLLISCGGGGSSDGGGNGTAIECIDGSGITSSHWAKTYDIGTTNVSTEFGGYINHADDGGYILAGSIGSLDFQSENSILIRLDSYGNVIWAKVLDAGGQHNRILFIQKTMDGGFIAHGTGDYGYLLIKFDSEGNLIWQKLYSDGVSVGQTSDGGYIIGGNRCIFKLDSAGDIEWSKNYENVGGLAKRIDDGGYIVVRSNMGIGGSPVDEIELLKIDENGEVIWFKEYDYVPGGVTWSVLSIHKTADGGYILEGYALGGSPDIVGGLFFIKLDSIGNVTWAKLIGAGHHFFYPINTTIQPTDGGGYVIVGDTSSFNAGFDDDIWVIKLNQDGEVVWQKTYGGDYSDHGNSVIEADDGGYVISGVTMSFGITVEGRHDGDLWVLKLRSDGTISPDTPFGFGVDTNADIVDLNFTVYEWPLLYEDCTVSVSDVSLTVTDVSINVCAQAWD